VLYALHGPSCYELALAILRDAHHAQDAVQEAFVHFDVPTHSK
jgi:DNA-directed RNA polymerase specialized sigma24 family protein